LTAQRAICCAGNAIRLNAAAAALSLLDFLERGVPCVDFLRSANAAVKLFRGGSDSVPEHRMIAFSCPHCRKPLRFDDEQAGAESNCPACGKSIIVPNKGLTLAASDAGKRSAVPQSPNDAAATLPPIALPASDNPSEAPTLPPGNPAAGDASTGETVDGVPKIKSKYPAELTDFLAPPQSADELGRLGKFRVLAVLGRGGMGVVFRAHDPHLDRIVALKAMLPSLASSPSAKERFFREAKAAAALKHANIVTIHDVGEDRGAPFLAMEFLEGESLDDRVKRAAPFPAADVARIGKAIAAGLAAAHQKGLIHRDMKPGNIWLEGDDGQVKLLDFGLARAMAEQTNLTQSGAIVGTPAYMAPEQATGKKVDHRCDLFSLGCVLYRMCTGEMAFKGPDTIAIIASLGLENPPPPSSLNPRIPARLEKLVMKLLAKKPDDRPASAQAVATELQAIFDEMHSRSETTAPLAEAVVDPWAGIDEESGEHEAGMPTEAMPRATAAAKLPRRGKSLLIAAALLVVLIAASAFIIVKNRDGKKIPVPEQDASKAATRPHRTAPNTPDKLKPLQIAGPDLHRKVAEWVLQRKTREIYLRRGGIDSLLTGEKLPEGEFEIGSISFELLSPEELDPIMAQMLSALSPKVGKHLSLSSNNWNDSTLRELIPQLREISSLYLYINSPAGISDDGLKNLLELQNLIGIYLSQPNITDKAIRTLQKLPNLHQVGLVGIPTTDATVDLLVSSRKFIHLTLIGTGATPSCLDSILNNQQLECLRLGGVALKDSDLPKLTSLRKLHELAIWDAPITNEGLRHLEPMQLHGVHLGGSQIDDGVFDYLAKYQSLENLAFTNVKITDTGLRKAKELPKLMRLHLIQVSGVTAEGVEKLRAELPKLSVILEGHPKEPKGQVINSDPPDLEFRLKEGNASANSLVIAPDGKTVVVGYADSCLRVWDLETRKVKLTFPTPGYVGSLALHPDGKTVAVNCGTDALFTWDIEKGEVVRRFTGQGVKHESVAFAQQGKSLVTASPDLKVIVWETATGKHRVLAQIPDGKDGIAIQTSPAGEHVAVRCAGHGVRIVNLNSGETTWTSRLPGIVTKPVFSANGKRIIFLGGQVPSLLMYEVGQQRLVTSFGARPASLNARPRRSLALGKGDRFLATDENDGNVLLWELTEQVRPVREWSKPAAGLTLDLAFTKDGSRLLTTHEDGTICVLKVPDTVPPWRGFPPLDAGWLATTSKLPLDEQVKEVAAELARRNPGFKDTLQIESKDGDGQVTSIAVTTSDLEDLSPFQAIPALRGLRISATLNKPGRVWDLSGLKGMKLTELVIMFNRVVDLGPLRDMPLVSISLTSNPVYDLSPLGKMHLEFIGLNMTNVEDISALRGMPLGFAGLNNTHVTDLSPLENSRVRSLTIRGDICTNLEPIRNLPIEDISVDQIGPISPAHAKFLQSMPKLKTINGKPKDEFFKEIDAADKKKP